MENIHHGFFLHGYRTTLIYRVNSLYLSESITRNMTTMFLFCVTITHITINGLKTARAFENNGNLFQTTSENRGPFEIPTLVISDGFLG